jgi:hypothetical protein
MCALAIAYMWLLLQRVATQRYSLIAVFLAIPSAFLRALAAKKAAVRGEPGSQGPCSATCRHAGASSLRPVGRAATQHSDL